MLKKLLHHLAGTSGFMPEEAEPLTIGGVPLLWSQEPLHLLLAGSTGTGKTTAVGELLDGITERGYRAVIVDPNGAYASMCWRRRKSEPPCRSQFEPGVEAGLEPTGCG